MINIQNHLIVLKIKKKNLKKKSNSGNENPNMISYFSLFLFFPLKSFINNYSGFYF